MQLEVGGGKKIKQEIQSIKAIVIGRLAKPLDGKGDEDETIEDQEEADETADDMREADETDNDDEVTTEIEDNQNEVDSESWEGLSAENEVEAVDEEEEVIKEPEAPARVPELIFQDGQWVE